jgi:LacI family transcriptional regulator
MPITRDVAQAADDWAATVSHLIEETRFASDALRQGVLTTNDRLGYQPNAVGGSLRHKRIHTWGMMLPHSPHPFTAEVARRIELASFAQTYNPLLCLADHAALFNSEEGISERNQVKPIAAQVDRS